MERDSPISSVSGWVVQGIFLPALLFALIPGCQREATRGAGLFSNGTAELYPPVAYPGPNTFTVSAPEGIRSTVVVFPDTTLLNLSTVEGGGEVENCPTTREFRVIFPTGIAAETIAVRVTTCSGEVTQITLPAQGFWNVDVIPFPELEPGERGCRKFSVTVNNLPTGYGLAERDGPSTIVDRVTSPDPRVSFEYATPPPIEVRRQWTYDVCFTSDTVGIFRIPIVTWVRRDYPSGGMTSYPVADTAVVTVRTEEE